MLEVYRLIFLCAIIYVNVTCAPSPEHIVYPKLLEARGINGTKLLHVKDGLTLSLEKLSVLADSLVFTESNDGVAIETIMNGTELEQTLYQDREKMAAVAVKEINDSIQVMGVLNDKLRIAPLPLMARSEEGHLAHRIYEVEPSINPEENDADTLPEQQARTKRRTRAASLEHIPDEFLVEVHVMVDEHHYTVFDRREDLVTYLALTIALVNMRYEDTTRPNIQFLLTSIQQEQGFAITFEEYDIGWPDAKRTYADASPTYNHLLEKYGRSPTDITVAVTGLILADNYEYFTYKEVAVKGQARLGGVCNVNYSTVMVEDAPMSFGMVSVLPHELGHALGAPHDGLTENVE
uniref:Putative tick metalloprotease n=2 Tax=Ixodes ricinus TaxID=34613 RepID=V5ICS5_IXORI